MIIYFSGTKNSEYIAKEIAKGINDFAISMTEIQENIVLKENENLGIISPTYFWGIPEYVETFLKNIKIENAQNSYIFCLMTYGTTTGQADFYIKKILKRKGLKLNASFSIKTVDNWTVEFNVNNKELIDSILKEEKRQINEIIPQIKNKDKVVISKDKKSKFLCMGAKVCYNNARKTKNFNVNDKCISCRLCAKNCPSKAIEIINGKPKWTKDKCTLCFRCLHRCPKFAINYKDKTQNNGQYVHPND